MSLTAKDYEAEPARHAPAAEMIRAVLEIAVAQRKRMPGAGAAGRVIRPPNHPFHLGRAPSLLMPRTSKRHDAAAAPSGPAGSVFAAPKLEGGGIREMGS
jgi:hypothetical protein